MCVCGGGGGGRGINHRYTAVVCRESMPSLEALGGRVCPDMRFTGVDFKTDFLTLMRIKSDAPTRPSLGYSVSGQGRQHSTFYGQREVCVLKCSAVLLLCPVLSCSSLW